MLRPLHRLLRKNVEWTWGDVEECVFQEVKQLLVEAPVLVPFDASLPVAFVTDASPYGIGSILEHVIRENGVEVHHPIAFYSRSLSGAEKKYAQIEREALAIISSVRHWSHFLLGRKFSLVTDHKPLVHIFSPDATLPKYTLGRLARWSLFLSDYDYDVTYVPTTDMPADFLSRAFLEKKVFYRIIP